jgi:hypothetical protein
MFLQVPGGGGGSGGLEVTEHALFRNIQAKNNTLTGTKGTWPGTWQTYAINAAEYNTIIGSSTSYPQVLLPAGTYNVWARAYDDNWGTSRKRVLRLYDITNTAVLLEGGGVYALDDDEHVVAGQVVLAATITLELQYYRQGNTYGGGCGLAVNWAHTNERYGYLLFEKVA